jgi:pyruvate/2-oxoglutarate dehydrogenase complex dihydrolipoamide acyltransferase (E2) component
MRPAARLTLVALVAACACGLAGCDSAKSAAQSSASQAAQKARSEASAAASKAASQAGDAAKQKAKEAATKQVCDLVTGSGPLADGTISTADRALAKAAATVGATAGVDQAHLAPLQTIADPSSSDSARQSAVAELQKVCG